MLSEEEVKHVAKLARITLTDAEVKKFSTQLSGVLDYMDILSEVDVSETEGTNQVTGLNNVMREDDVKASPASREQLLETSELPVDSKQVRVLPAIK